MFGRRPPLPPIQLDGLITTFGRAAGFWESQPRPEILVRARLADACRDQHIKPASEARFQASWTALDAEQRLRFCILTEAFELPEAAAALPKVCGHGGSAEPALALLQRSAVQLQYLTGSVLRESDIRLEEFARTFCAAWELGIHGETPPASAARLHAIDFSRLMQEANAARASAEERLAYLRTLQEEQEKTRRPRRGKW